jgi:hypothetical protein
MLVIWSMLAASPPLIGAAVGAGEVGVAAGPQAARTVRQAANNMLRAGFMFVTPCCNFTASARNIWAFVGKCGGQFSAYCCGRSAGELVVAAKKNEHETNALSTDGWEPPSMAEGARNCLEWPDMGPPYLAKSRENNPFGHMCRFPSKTREKAQDE